MPVDLLIGDGLQLQPQGAQIAMDVNVGAVTNDDKIDMPLGRERDRSSSTDDTNPQKAKRAKCKHCRMMVYH